MGNRGKGAGDSEIEECGGEDEVYNYNDIYRCECCRRDYGTFDDPGAGDATAGVRGAIGDAWRRPQGGGSVDCGNQ